MKKAYNKPEIVFESFTMSTNIAAGCVYVNVTFSEDLYGCGYKVGNNGKVVFATEMGCTTTPDDGPYNQICYHTPTDSSSLFTS